MTAGGAIFDDGKNLKEPGNEGEIPKVRVNNLNQLTAMP